MRLNDEQKAMLNGDMGEGKRVAMEMLYAIGNVYGAEDLIPIKSAHCAGLSLKSHGLAGMKWVEDMAAKGAKVVVPTTMNVVGVDRSRDLGLPMDWVEPQMRIEKGYEAMGCFGTSSCVPYYYSFLPRFGEHIAWAESSAVIFTNSVLGARDNQIFTKIVLPASVPYIFAGMQIAPLPGQPVSADIPPITASIWTRTAPVTFSSR